LKRIGVINAVEKIELENIKDKGVAVLRGYLSNDLLESIENDVFGVVAGVSASVNFSAASQFFPGEVDRTVVEAIKRRPDLQPVIYDRLQQMPNLLASPARNEFQSLAQELLGTKRIGVWPRTQLRMDLPGDQHNLIRWHNDYIYNKGTVDSYTFWFPLADLTEEMGPLKFALGSHKRNLDAIETKGPERFSFDLPEATVAKLDVVTPQVKRGDLVVFHSLLWHTGQINKTADRARLSGLFRLQNLNRLEVQEDKRES
jgi:hypothetical protein